MILHFTSLFRESSDPVSPQRFRVVSGVIVGGISGTGSLILCSQACAYLQGSLEPSEVLYCTTPPRYATAEVGGGVKLVAASDGDGVDRLRRDEKPLYGIARAGCRWQRTLFLLLLARGARLRVNLVFIKALWIHAWFTAGTPWQLPPVLGRR